MSFKFNPLTGNFDLVINKDVSFANITGNPTDNIALAEILDSIALGNYADLDMGTF